MRTPKAKPARAGNAGKRPRSRAVTADRFQTARLTACLSVPATAKLLHVTERTVHNWESGRSRVPYAAYKLLRVLRGFDLGHPAWAGFRLDGPTLWTPEGHAFRPDHLTWWSLTCRMADEFRRMVARDRATAAGRSLGLVSTGTSHTDSSETQQRRGFQPFDRGAIMGPEWGHESDQTAGKEVQFEAACGSDGTSPAASRRPGRLPECLLPAGHSQLHRLDREANAGQPASAGRSAEGGGRVARSAYRNKCPAPCGAERALPLRQWPEGQAVPPGGVRPVGGAP